MSPQVRVEVAIRRGEQLAVNEFADALKEYQKALDTQKNSSMAHLPRGADSSSSIITSRRQTNSAKCSTEIYSRRNGLRSGRTFISGTSSILPVKGNAR